MSFLFLHLLHSPSNPHAVSYWSQFQLQYYYFQLVLLIYKVLSILLSPVAVILLHPSQQLRYSFIPSKHALVSLSLG